jgi:hypothetical protein
MERRAASHTEEEEMNHRRRLLNAAKKGDQKAIGKLLELYQVRIYSGDMVTKMNKTSATHKLQAQLAEGKPVKGGESRQEDCACEAHSSKTHTCEVGFNETRTGESRSSSCLFEGKAKISASQSSSKETQEVARLQLLHGHSKSPSRQFCGDFFRLCQRTREHDGFPIMIDLPCQLKGLRGVHSRNVLAEERNDLLIGMTLAVEHDHTRVEPGTCVDASGLCRDGGCEGGFRAGHGNEF